MIINRRTKIITMLGPAALTLSLSLIGCSTINQPDEPPPNNTTATAPPLPSGAGSPLPNRPNSADPTVPGPELDGNGPPSTAASEQPAPTADTRKPIQQTGKKGKPRGLKLNLDKVDSHDADEVATAFGTVLGSYDTKIDNSINDAGRRAAKLATPKLAEALKEATAVTGPDADWRTLERHNGYTTVTTQLGGLGPNPPDGPTSTVRAVTLTIQRHGRGGWKPAPDDPRTLLITLHRDNPKADWAVADFEYL